MKVVFGLRGFVRNPCSVDIETRLRRLQNIGDLEMLDRRVE